MIYAADGEGLTPTQAAKRILLDAASSASQWPQGYAIDTELLTDAERKRIDAALLKQWERVQRLLGYEGWSLQ